MSNILPKTSIQKYKMLFKTLKYILHKHPFKFNLISCGLFGFAGDYACQRFEFWQKQQKNERQRSASNSEEFRHNLKRSTQMGLAALTMGPFLHYWYRFLDNKWPKATIKHVLTKVYIDYAVAIPYYICFFGSLTYIKEVIYKENFDKISGKTSFNIENFKNQVSQKIPVLLVIDFFLWPLFQGLNFYFLPMSLRVVGTKVAEIFFDGLLSWVAHNEIDLEGLVGLVIGKEDDGKMN